MSSFQTCAIQQTSLEYEQQWREGNYDRWIQLVPRIGGSINSVRYKMDCLSVEEIHTMFDHYDFSINPDVCWFLCPCIFFSFPVSSLTDNG